MGNRQWAIGNGQKIKIQEPKAKKKNQKAMGIGNGQLAKY
jgi:hypothetical protein